MKYRDKEKTVTQEEPKAELSGTVIYTIKGGDTLQSITEQYGVTVKDLYDLNSSSILTNMVAGRKIRVR